MLGMVFAKPFQLAISVDQQTAKRRVSGKATESIVQILILRKCERIVVHMLEQAPHNGVTEMWNLICVSENVELHQLLGFGDCHLLVSMGSLVMRCNDILLLVQRNERAVVALE